MGFGYFGAGLGHLFNGEELLALSAVHQVPGSAFTKAGDGQKRRKQLTVDDEEFGRVAFVNIYRQELETSQIEFIGYFQRRQKILVLVSGVFIVFDGIPNCLV